MKIALSLSLAISILLSGCAKQAEQVSSAGVGGIEVARLFTHDGCTVYRFGDAGRFVYFSKCSEKSEVFWNEVHSCGKNCTRTEPHSVPSSREMDGSHAR